MRRAALAQAGFALPELLVAMALSLSVLLGAASWLVASVRAHAALRASVALDEGGQFALDLLSRAVRQAAQPGASPSGARIAGLDARTLSRTSAALDAPLTESVNGSDVLAVRVPGTGAAPDGDGATRDCAGIAIGAERESWSIFYVARDAQGVPELRCKYQGQGGWASEAVLSGVDGFQLLYGLDLDGDGAPNRYVNASTIAALDAQAGAPPSYWTKVASVKVALLLTGPRLAGSHSEPVVHLFGPAYAAGPGAADPGTTLTAHMPDRDASAPLRQLVAATIAVPVAP